MLEVQWRDTFTSDLSIILLKENVEVIGLYLSDDLKTGNRLNEREREIEKEKLEN